MAPAEDTFESHVMPHGSLREVVPGKLWAVEGSLKPPFLPRTMLVFRQPDDGLLITSVTALEEPTMRELEQLGRLDAFIVPNKYHTLDISVFKKRYPDAKVFCPAAEQAAIEKKIGFSVDGTCGDEFAAGSDSARRRGTTCHAVKGGAEGLEVYAHNLGGGGDTGGGTGAGNGGAAVWLGDNLFAVSGPPTGVLGRAVRAVFDVSGPLHFSRMGRWFFVKDKPVLQSWLRDLHKTLAMPPRVLVPAHGDIVVGESECTAALAAAADRL